MTRKRQPTASKRSRPKPTKLARPDLGRMANMSTGTNIEIGQIENEGGELNIAGGSLVVTRGYTADQVSVLLTQIASTFQPKPFDGRSPYKGLAVFEAEDTELFFGRERLVADLIRRLKTFQSLFITGPSGSGKSSLVRAGLIPALQKGCVENSEHWLYETMKPGREPLIELGRVASSLARTLSAGEDIRTKGLQDATVFSRWCEIALSDNRRRRVVLFIDQFEELFTQVSREEERAAFLNLVLQAATSPRGGVILLFAMRSDFVSHCAVYPHLNTLLNQQFVQIGAMQADELVSAIAQPALRVGLRVDPALIAQIIDDMRGEPGALPLMQFALKDLFDAEQAKAGLISLKLEDYLQRGGIHKALERHADAEFAKLSKEEKLLAENLFKGLVEIGDNPPATRRNARFDEFASSATTMAALQSVVTKLADARLISTDESEETGRTVTLAHEKLIEAWPWLKQLVQENRLAIQLQNQILEDALEWERHNYDQSYLYTGTRLTSIQKSLRTSRISNEKALLFLRASGAADHRNQSQRVLLAGLLLLMALAIYVAVIQPLFTSEISLQEVDMGGAGVNALQQLPDGTVYAGMYNNRIQGGGPCLARLRAPTTSWERFGPTCMQTVLGLWADPLHPERIYFAEAGDEPVLYSTSDGGETWSKYLAGENVPMQNITTLTGTEDGRLFAGDAYTPVGVYLSDDQGQTWSALSGSPSTTISTVVWVPGEGLLAGGNGGLWLWRPNGEWEQVVSLDAVQKRNRILSVLLLPADRLTVLAGGEEGVYRWTEGGPVQTTPKNDLVKKAWSLALVTVPDPYVIGYTYPNSKIWRMSTDGESARLMKDVGSDGFSLIVHSEDPLRLWVGTLDGFYAGDLRKKLLQFFQPVP